MPSIGGQSLASLVDATDIPPVISEAPAGAGDGCGKDGEHGLGVVPPGRGGMAEEMGLGESTVRASTSDRGSTLFVRPSSVGQQKNDAGGL